MAGDEETQLVNRYFDWWTHSIQLIRVSQFDSIWLNKKNNKKQKEANGSNDQEACYLSHILTLASLHNN